LDDALSVSQLEEVESQFGIRLPEEYRTFLLDMGSGGCGPMYGVFPLLKQDGAWLWDGDGASLTTNPAAPFRHTAAWNLDGHPIWKSKPDEDDERFDSESFEDALEAWQEKFTEVYWDPKWTEGAICLCHHGCAKRSWLVVTGEERGNMWYDATADEEGLEPHSSPTAKRLTFFEWYTRWLDRVLEEIRS
jgi:hypothetical protein